MIRYCVGGFDLSSGLAAGFAAGFAGGLAACDVVVACVVVVE
jgi:hypothetical protein